MEGHTNPNTIIFTDLQGKIIGVFSPLTTEIRAIDPNKLYEELSKINMIKNNKPTTEDMEDLEDLEIGYLPRSRRIVFQTLNEMVAASNLEIARKLDWDVNRITPRIHELRQEGLVVKLKKAKSPITGKKSIVWTPNIYHIKY